MLLFSRSRDDHTPMVLNTVMPTIVGPSKAAAPARGYVDSNTIPMYSGGRFNYRDPHGCAFRIRDVARGLSRLVRFTGQARGGYSVAQHSVLGSYLVEPQYAYDFLMHDGHESVTGDVNSPLKRMLPDYQRLENEVCDAFRTYFGCSLRDLPAVKRADLIMLVTEFRDVMNGIECGADCEGIKPSPKRIRVWPAWYAEWRFLRRFRQLVGNRVTHETACC